VPSLLDGLAVRSLVRMPISDSEQINISRCMDEKQVNELARFFIENVEISYISHSEVQIGRAISEKQWNPDLLTLLQEEFTSIIRSKGRGRNAYILLVSRISSRVVGLCIFHCNKTYARSFAVIEDLVIDRDFRGKGVGSKMVAWVENEALKMNISNIYIESGKNNHTAHSFFKKKGFRNVSLVMMKKLSH